MPQERELGKGSRHKRASSPPAAGTQITMVSEGLKISGRLLSRDLPRAWGGGGGGRGGVGGSEPSTINHAVKDVVQRKGSGINHEKLQVYIKLA